MFMHWRTLWDSLPGTCQVCGAWPSRPVCEACTCRFQDDAPRCTTCATRLPAGTVHCGPCMNRSAPATLRACAAAVDYAYPWDGLIARFKFRQEPGWAGPFAQEMLRNPMADALLSQSDLIAPVPLAPARLAERGYNQAWELVKALRRRRPPGSRPPALADALVRLIEAPAQHRLSREQRLSNLRGVFAAHPMHAARLRGRHVLLVDDVTTTGATLHAAAQALMQAGAGSVSALVFAHTPPR
ncbi:ComF family protein [Hydrogenophaga laconesensis]|uniref:ComF family protein n=1 Tax=Hydrogenophaga laconesensis TaxID=1805971 RepID=A0ABU1VC08_9BURK|nr:ComF family protein [Hydrogenophaga laconesensis]MDR7094999.1 ComF family protein [Hydrogenophaga laconesensis]